MQLGLASFAELPFASEDGAVKSIEELKNG